MLVKRIVDASSDFEIDRAEYFGYSYDRSKTIDTGDGDSYLIDGVLYKEEDKKVVFEYVKEVKDIKTNSQAESLIYAEDLLYPYRSTQEIDKYNTKKVLSFEKYEKKVKGSYKKFKGLFITFLLTTILSIVIMIISLAIEVSALVEAGIDEYSTLNPVAAFCLIIAVISFPFIFIFGGIRKRKKRHIVSSDELLLNTILDGRCEYSYLVCWTYLANIYSILKYGQSLDSAISLSLLTVSKEIKRSPDWTSVMSVSEYKENITTHWWVIDELSKAKEHSIDEKGFVYKDEFIDYLIKLEHSSNLNKKR